MKLIAPDYYTLFTCIGSRCAHNCCIGWEIDVDDFTLSYYKAMNGFLGEKLRDSICIDDDGAHFVLSKDDRCPFLDTVGLCQIIKEAGEDALCDICADHPRFRNFFSDRVEIGLGLSCEEAARIIVSCEKDVSLVLLDDDNTDEIPNLTESHFFSEREKLFSVIQKRDRSFIDKVLEICTAYNLTPFDNLSEWTNLFFDMEHLTSEWPNLLKNLTNTKLSMRDVFSKIKFDKAFENLLHYFIFRHFLPTDSCEEKRAMVGACALSVCVIGAVCILRGEMTVESLTDTARLYSSEIEYSDINFENLINAFK